MGRLTKTECTYLPTSAQGYTSTHLLQEKVKMKLQTRSCSFGFCVRRIRVRWCVIFSEIIKISSPKS